MEHHKSYGNAIGPLGFPLPDKQARVLDTLLKSLPKTKEYEFKRAVTTKAPTELNPGERSDVSWISTESVDRMGEVVIAKGMNDSQFQGNPLVTIGHAYYLPPVGKSLWRKRIKDGAGEGAIVGIKAKTQYPSKPSEWSENDPWPPDKVLMLIQAGLLQGKSIGFLPTKVHIPDEREIKKNNWGDVGLVIDEWLLLEYACCFLPCNQDALVEQVSKGLELPQEIIKAMGLESISLKAPQPPTGPPSPSCITFTTLEEIQKDVQGRIMRVDFSSVVEKAIEASFDKARGRV